MAKEPWLDRRDIRWGEAVRDRGRSQRPETRVARIYTSERDVDLSERECTSRVRPESWLTVSTTKRIRRLTKGLDGFAHTKRRALLYQQLEFLSFPIPLFVHRCGGSRGTESRLDIRHVLHRKGDDSPLPLDHRVPR